MTTPYFSLKMKDNREGENRIGIVVPGAVHKSAARRNFWKRQARAALGAVSGAGKDVLLVISPKITPLTKKQFKKIFSEAAARFKNFKS